jgi:periplasmic protein TonB
MTKSFAARGSRQTVVLAAIVGLHLGVFFPAASGLLPRAIEIVTERKPIQVVLREKEPIERVAPESTAPAAAYELRVEQPRVDIPSIEESANALDAVVEPPTGSASIPGVAKPGAGDYRAPAVRTRDRRLAALIDRCYPAASRRLGEEGRAVAAVTIGAGGRASAWRLTESSGHPRLDAAMGCVINQIEFVAGRRDGRAVEADASLPVIFRLD